MERVNLLNPFSFKCECGENVEINPDDILVDSLRDKTKPVAICDKCDKLMAIDDSLIEACKRDDIDYIKLLNEIRFKIIMNIKAFSSDKNPGSTLHELSKSLVNSIYDRENVSGQRLHQ